MFLIFEVWNFIKLNSNWFYFKFDKGKNGIDFSSNIDNAQKSLAKVLNDRIEKLSTLLDANETQLNVANIISEISIEREYELNKASEHNSCSSTIKVNPLLISKSKRFKMNSSNKKYKCETCKKRFKTSTELKIHNRIHSKEKPFACDQCQMTFCTKGNLTTHKRLHTGEKPYQCDICQKNSPNQML